MQVSPQTHRHVRGKGLNSRTDLDSFLKLSHELLNLNLSDGLRKVPIGSKRLKSAANTFRH